ncbi:MAG: ATP-binding cassette domain-containing protein, partial [Proteobacteria bacterium]
MSERTTTVLKCLRVTKRFREGDLDVDVLRGIDFTVCRGESVAIIGASGAGKSTLLHIVGGLDRPHSGTVRVGGQDVQTLSDDVRARLRN